MENIVKNISRTDHKKQHKHPPSSPMNGPQTKEI